MNISSSLSSLTSLSSLSSLSRASAVSQVATTEDAGASDATSSADGAAARPQLSKMGELMSKLQDLEASDPAKAKQVLSSIASQLSDKASASGTSDAHLQELADKFKQAADTGDLSVLKPEHGGGHGGPGGVHGGGGPPPPPPPSSSSSSSDDSDGSDDPTSASSSSSLTSAVRKAYGQGSSGGDPMAQVESIISNALSSAYAS